MPDHVPQDWYTSPQQQQQQQGTASSTNGVSNGNHASQQSSTAAAGGSAAEQGGLTAAFSGVCMEIGVGGWSREWASIPPLVLQLQGAVGASV